MHKCATHMHTCAHTQIHTHPKIRFQRAGGEKEGGDARGTHGEHSATKGGKPTIRAQGPTMGRHNCPCLEHVVAASRSSLFAPQPEVVACFLPRHHHSGRNGGGRGRGGKRARDQATLCACPVPFGSANATGITFSGRGLSGAISVFPATRQPQNN